MWVDDEEMFSSWIELNLKEEDCYYSSHNK